MPVLLASLNVISVAAPRVSRATVYRTFGHLQDSGVIRQVCFGNRQCLYEVAADADGWTLRTRATPTDSSHDPVTDSEIRDVRHI